jgi:hypothetical protein
LPHDRQRTVNNGRFTAALDTVHRAANHCQPAKPVRLADRQPDEGQTELVAAVGLERFLDRPEIDRYNSSKARDLLVASLEIGT